MQIKSVVDDLCTKGIEIKTKDGSWWGRIIKQLAPSLGIMQTMFKEEKERKKDEILFEHE